jgi:hypothetical protein
VSCMIEKFKKRKKKKKKREREEREFFLIVLKVDNAFLNIGNETFKRIERKIKIKINATYISQKKNVRFTTPIQQLLTWPTGI